MAPKFATVKANIRTNVPAPAIRRVPAPVASTSADGTMTQGVVPGAKPGVNPYYDRNIVVDASAFKDRTQRKQLKFNQKGKYTRLAEQMRQEQKLEALKQRIAEASKKAGLVEDIESGAMIKRAAPPDVEWWDSQYLRDNTYDNLPDETQPEDVILRMLDVSAITALIQHPIPIPAPGDKHQQALKPLFLTKKEMKKLRRNRRAAEHKDLQDRIRMGLAPPQPDKGMFDAFHLCTHSLSCCSQNLQYVSCLDTRGSGRSHKDRGSRQKRDAGAPIWTREGQR